MQTEYCFIEIVSGRPYHPGDIRTLDEAALWLAALPPDTPDVFTSMFQFRSELVEHAKAHGMENCDGLPCWSPWLWLDVDKPGDLQAAFADTDRLLDVIADIDPALLNHVRIFFSGSKGCNIAVPVGDLFEPCVDLPRKHAAVAFALAAKAGIDIDPAIYNSARIWRVAGTINSKSGEKLWRKTPITRDDVKACAADISALERALSNKPTENLSSLFIDGAAALHGGGSVAFKNFIETALAATAAHDRSPAGDRKPVAEPTEIDRERLVVLLEHGCNKSRGGGVGDKANGRDNACLLRADKLRLCGYDRNTALEKLTAWNGLNGKPLSKTDLKRILKSAYDKEPPYDFGFDDEARGPELKAAQDLAQERLHNRPTKSRDVFKPVATTRRRTAKEIPTDEIVRRVFAGYDQLCEKANANVVRIIRMMETGISLAENAVPEKRQAVWRSLDRILADENVVADREPLSEWLAWRRKLTFPFCIGKEGKSTLGTCDALSAIERGHRVAWLTMEESESDVKERAATMKADKSVWQDFFVMADITPHSEKECFGLIEQIVFAQSVDIVYIDSWAAYQSNVLGLTGKSRLNTTEAEEVANHIRRLKILVATPLDIAIVMLGHSGKDPDSLFPRGSSGQIDAPDMLVRLTGTKEDITRKIIYQGRWTQDNRVVAFNTSTNRFDDKGVTTSGAKRGTKLEKITGLLFDLLRGGGRPKSEIRKIARNEWKTGNSTLYAACAALGIDRDKRKNREWSLPPKISDPTDQVKNKPTNKGGIRPSE